MVNEEKDKKENYREKASKIDKLDDLAFVVFETALEKFPNNNELAEQIMIICSGFEGEWIQNLKESIYERILENYSTNAILVVNTILGYFNIDNGSKTAEDWLNLTNKINEYLDNLKEVNNIDDYIISILQVIINKIKKLYAVDSKLEQSYLNLLDQLLKRVSLGNVLKSKEMLNSLTKLVKSMKIISEQSSIVLSEAFSKLKDTNDTKLIIRILRAFIIVKAVEKVEPGFDLASYSRNYLKNHNINITNKQKCEMMIWITNSEATMNRKDADIIIDLRTSIKMFSLTEFFKPYVLNYWEKIIKTRGFESKLANESINILLNLKNACPPEVNYQIVENLKMLKNDALVKKYYNRALEIHSTNQQLWLGYMEWEKNNGNPLNCQDILYK